MIWLCIIGYTLIIGVIVMDRGHELDISLRIIRKKLHPFKIMVDITIHDNETVTLTATKNLGITFQHASIHCENMIVGVNKLIDYINDNWDEWVTPDPY